MDDDEMPSSLELWRTQCTIGTNTFLIHITYTARTYLQPHYGNGVWGNVYLSSLGNTY